MSVHVLAFPQSSYNISVRIYIFRLRSSPSVNFSWQTSVYNVCKESHLHQKEMHQKNTKKRIKEIPTVSLRVSHPFHQEKLYKQRIMKKTHKRTKNFRRSNCQIRFLKIASSPFPGPSSCESGYRGQLTGNSRATLGDEEWQELWWALNPQD